jgi:dTDP-4-dehydrorhamnose reductase
MKKKVLITGSNGFIGQKMMTEVLADKNFDLIALSRGSNRYSNPEGYLYIDGDVCNPEQMAEVISQHRPHFIIHTVAMANVEACEANIEACEQVNVEAVKTLVSLAEKYDSHLIHLSTDFIFDGKEGPYAETAIPHPLNEYGKSKLEAEKLIQASSIKWAIIRTILVYGVPNDKDRSNLILWVKNSLEAGKKINVVTDHYRMPTLVEDLTKATLSIMDKQAKGIYHISGSEGYSIYDIAMQVAKFWDLDTSIIQPVDSSTIESAVSRPSYTGFVLDKAMADLDFRPHALKDGLALMKQQLQH